MRELVVSFGRANNFAKIVETATLPWDELVLRLVENVPETEDKGAVGWYCPAHFEPAYRDSKNLIARHCLTFDYDEIEPEDLVRIERAYFDYTYLLYTTASHKWDKPRVRVVFPLSDPVDKEEFACITRTIGDRFNLDKLARESDTPAQMMFKPSKKPGADFWFKTNDADWIEVDEILSEYDDWKDKSKWPVRSERDNVNAVNGEDIPDPDTKSGIVGDFCRAYKIPEAIDRFELPYERGSNDLRWTYTDGSRPDGLRIYDGGLKAHSEHNTDPAYGQHNAFDLVRLHKFADLVSGEDESRPITERESYKRMSELALSLPEVQEQRVLAEFQDLGDDDEQHLNGSTRRFEVIPAPAFAKHRDVDWLIKGVLPRADLAVVYGPPTSGKSFLALDLCGAIVCQDKWRDHRVTKGRAVYVAAEGSEGMRQRIRAYTHQHEEEMADMGVVGNAPNLMHEKDVAEITKAICEYGTVDLVVIDTLAASMPGGDENTGKDVGKIVEHCKFIRRKTGAMVLLVHHSGKDATKGARGWSGLRAAADAEIEVTRQGDIRTATVMKLKDGQDGTRWSFTLPTVVLGWDTDGDEITSCYVEHMDTPSIPRPKTQVSGTYAKHVMQVAKETMNDGSAMDMKDLISRSIQQLPKVAEGKRDTRKQSVGRAITKLVVDGHLFKAGDRISLTRAMETEDF